MTGCADCTKGMSPLPGESGSFPVKVKVKSLSRVPLFVSSRTVAYQAPPSEGFSRQEYWSGLPFPSPGDLPNPGIKLSSPALAGEFFTTELPGKPSPFPPSSYFCLYFFFLFLVFPLTHLPSLSCDTCSSSYLSHLSFSAFAQAGVPSSSASQRG